MFVNHEDSCGNYPSRNYNLKSGRMIGILKWMSLEGKGEE